MKAFTYFATIILCFGITLNINAQNTSGAQPSRTPLGVQDLKMIQEKLRLSQDLQLDFVQTSISGLRGSKSTRIGQAIFSNPDKFKWMLETPVREYKIFDGKSFIDYSPDSETAIRHSPNGKQVEQLKQIVDVVMKFDSLLKNYELISAYREQLVYVVLRPKKASDIREISIILDEKASFVTNVTLQMANKNKLIHEFKNPRRAAFSQELFTLPAKVKVSQGF